MLRQSSKQNVFIVYASTRKSRALIATCRHGEGLLRVRMRPQRCCSVRCGREVEVITRAIEDVETVFINCGGGEAQQEGRGGQESECI